MLDFFASRLRVAENSDELAGVSYGFTDCGESESVDFVFVITAVLRCELYSSLIGKAGYRVRGPSMSTWAIRTPRAGVAIAVCLPRRRR